MTTRAPWIEMALRGEAEIRAQQQQSDGFVAGTRVGEVIATEAKVADEIRKLDRDYTCLDIAFKTTNYDPANQQEVGFRQGWDTALGSWKKFVRDNPATGLAGLGVYVTGTGNLIRSINEYRTTLVAWDKAFRERYPQVATSCPAPNSPGPVPGLFGVPSTSQNTSQKPGEGWPWWVTSGLTLAAVGGVAYLGYATWRYYQTGTREIEYVRREVIPQALGLPRRAPRRAHDRDPDEGLDRGRRTAYDALLPYRIPRDEGLTP